MLTAMAFVCNQQYCESGLAKKQMLKGQLLPRGLWPMLHAPAWAAALAPGTPCCVGRC